MHFTKLHWGDYSKNTSHLSLLEHGVYMQIMRVYYSTEKPISDKQKYRCIGARTEEEKAAVDAVLDDFFQQIDGKWHLERCDKEIKKYHERQAINKQNAKQPRRKDGF